MEGGQDGRGMLNLAWVCNEEALSREFLLTLPRLVNKFVAEQDSKPPSPQTAELELELA